MVATLLSETSNRTGFSVTGLIIVIIVFAVLFPLQKKLREGVSARRRERWAREDAELGLDRTTESPSKRTGTNSDPDDEPSHQSDDQPNDQAGDQTDERGA